MAEVGFGEVNDGMVEFPYELHSAQAYRDRAFSSLHLIPQEELEAGVEQMEQDLRRGPIKCVSRYSLLWGTNPS